MALREIRTPAGSRDEFREPGGQNSIHHTKGPGRIDQFWVGFEKVIAWLIWQCLAILGGSISSQMESRSGLNIVDRDREAREGESSFFDYDRFTLITVIIIL